MMTIAIANPMKTNITDLAMKPYYKQLLEMRMYYESHTMVFGISRCDTYCSSDKQEWSTGDQCYEKHLVEFQHCQKCVVVCFRR